MVAHRDLSGADLHEPKGVDTASVHTVYAANGAGSGSWTQLSTNSLDLTSLKNINREQMFSAYIDIGTAGSRYQAWAKAVRVVKIVAVIQTNTSGAATLLTFRNDAGTAMATMNIPNGATAGTVFTVNPISNNTFAANTKIQIDSDGGTSTNTNASFTFELEWT